MEMLRPVGRVGLRIIGRGGSDERDRQGVADGGFGVGVIDPGDELVGLPPSRAGQSN